MEEQHVKNYFAGPVQPGLQNGNRYIATTASSGGAVSPPENLNRFSLDQDLDEEEDMDVMEEKLTDEDAQSLIGPSISYTATRLRSLNTPAAERAAAMEELDGGGLFESDAETPPLESESGIIETETEGQFPTEVGKISEPVEEKPTTTAHPTRQKEGLSLGRLPSPKLEQAQIPTPWHAGPKPFVVQPARTAQSSLQGVFSSQNQRNRSLSGGAEALRKFLPSMSQMGNLFNSSTTKQKRKSSISAFRSTKQSDSNEGTRSGGSSSSGGSPKPGYSPRLGGFEPIVASRPQTQGHHLSPAGGPIRPKILRRVTSDDSLLYHSLSRASSLGDDTRFEHQKDQVNSRAKAIRDSLQDRSSFRMPQMPSMPKILPGNLVKQTTTPTTVKPASAAAPGLVAAAVSSPEVAAESAKAVNDEPTPNFLDTDMASLTGDVVIMGGYRGSILRSTKTKRQLWVPVKVGLNIRKVDLEVGLEPEDEERMEEKIYASGMLQNIGPVDISKRLFKRLYDCENAKNGKLRVWDYGYDWRLSPRLLAQKLTEFLEKLPSNLPNKDDTSNPKPGALVIAHSLGGLITRHVVNHRPELFSGVIYAGVPQACVNILGPIRNGDAVLLSSRVLTAQVNFTLRTSFVLLPEDGHCFIDINTGEKYPVDFFDVNSWINGRFSPCLDPPFPPRNPPSPTGLGGMLTKSGSFLNLPSLPLSGKKSPTSPHFPNHVGNTPNENNTSKTFQQNQSQPPSSKTSRIADTIRGAEGGTDRTLAPQMGSTNPVSKGNPTSSSISTTVTIPRPVALAYLTRVLAETKLFKSELHHRPHLSAQNRYPPLALIYGKSIPTLYGAKVDGREGIPCSDSYDNLAFASGDGVCLAKQAMLPDGYKAVKGGRISSDRGHVTLLGDLGAVGRAIEAVLRGREKGIGLGLAADGSVVSKA